MLYSRIHGMFSFVYTVLSSAVMQAVFIWLFDEYL